MAVRIAHAMATRKLLLVLIIALVLVARPVEGKTKKRQRQARSDIRERRGDCKTQTCQHLVPLEAENCINECVSSTCFGKVFEEPLEDGEVNQQLTEEFEKCARKETASKMQKSRRK